MQYIGKYDSAPVNPQKRAWLTGFQPASLGVSPAPHIDGAVHFHAGGISVMCHRILVSCVLCEIWTLSVQYFVPELRFSIWRLQVQLHEYLHPLCPCICSSYLLVSAASTGEGGSLCWNRFERVLHQLPKCYPILPQSYGITFLGYIIIVAKKRDPGILDPELFLGQIRKVEARLGKLAKIRKVETG